MVRPAPRRSAAALPPLRRTLRLRSSYAPLEDLPEIRRFGQRLSLPAEWTDARPASSRATGMRNGEHDT